MPDVRQKYQTLEFEKADIHVKTLRDKQQFDEEDEISKNLGISSATWSLFGVIWPSGEVLAHMMFDYHIEEKRILEVGCGIALASLVLNHRMANITATDYHPEVQKYLNNNTNLNNDTQIPFVRADWEEEYNKGLGKFDLIIGSDLLYERGHFGTLSKFISCHTKDNCEVIIVDPGRGGVSKFTQEMSKFGFNYKKIKPENTQYLKDQYNGFIHQYIK